MNIFIISKKLQKSVFVLLGYISTLCFSGQLIASHQHMILKPKQIAGNNLTAPRLTNNPSWDVIATNRQPLLSFYNATGGKGKRTYQIQLDKKSSFDSESLLEYKGVPEINQYISSKLIDEKDALEDQSRYYWRVRAIDEDGVMGPWAQSRFYLDTKSDDVFMNLVRLPVSNVRVSSGQNPKNIIDLDDPGQVSFWQSTPPGSSTQWVEMDLGKVREVSRIWMLSNINSVEGWLKDFVWQVSDDGNSWKDIAETSINGNDTFRNILNCSARGRYFRLFIKNWYGYGAQVNAIILYSKGMPLLPDVPKDDYVLIVGDQVNGFTFTELQEFVEGLDLNLKTIVVPHYEVSLEMVNNFKKKPVAIILSGNNADYKNLPMYEYNGVYELIRESNIPILGICCGHQLSVMAYGYTYTRGLGWDAISSLDHYKDRFPVKIVKDDPIFEGMPNPFNATEIHGWAVAHLPKDYEVLAFSDYIQALKSTSKMLYGEQFHAEIKRPLNQGTPYLINFLKMAIKKRKEER